MNKFLSLEYLIIFSLVISVSLTVIVILINHIKKTKTSKNTIDKNHYSVQKLVSELNEFKTLNWKIYKKGLDSYIKKTDTLLTQLTNELNIIPESKSFKLFLNQEELVSQITKERLESQIKEINESKITPEISLGVKHNYYYVNDSKYRHLVSLHVNWATAKKYYDELIDSIKEALSSVDSAQMTETIDLFSANKGISMLSTLNNSEVNSDVDQVRHNYNKLKNHLDSIKSDMEYSKSTIQKINDVPDLMIDLVLDFSLDFMSIFSLSKLNDIESDLEGFMKNVLKLEPEINLRFNQSKANQDKYLNAQD